MKKIKQVNTDKYIAQAKGEEYKGTTAEMFFYAFAFFALLFVGSQLLK